MYIRAITTTALMIVLSLILDQIKLFHMPQGGSVTLLGKLPIVLLGYLLGVRWGVLGGVITGLLNIVFGGYIVHPVQLILDYVLAFGAMGLSGLVRDRKNGLTQGYIVSMIGRYICATLSGWIFFGEYAPENFSALTWALWYNLTYVGGEGILTLIVINIPPVRKMFERMREQLANA